MKHAIYTQISGAYPPYVLNYFEYRCTYEGGAKYKSVILCLAKVVDVPKD